MVTSLALRNLELEAAILEAPGDLDAFEVYADWLLERGVAHGEIISFAVRRRRAGKDATTDFPTLAAEARLLQDRARVFGPIGGLPRNHVNYDLELGFFAGVRVYATGDDAAHALRLALTERVGAFLRDVAVLDRTRLIEASPTDDRATTRAIWSVLEAAPLPRSVTSVALPLMADLKPEHFNALAGVAHCTFPLRNIVAIARELPRLRALRSLTLTSNRPLDRLTTDTLIEHARIFTPLPIQIRPRWAPPEHRDRLREALPQISFG